MDLFWCEVQWVVDVFQFGGRACYFGGYDDVIVFVFVFELGVDDVFSVVLCFWVAWYVVYFSGIYKIDFLINGVIELFVFFCFGILFIKSYSVQVNFVYFKAGVAKF